MKKASVDLWFPPDYYDILAYTSVNYRSIYSYEEEYIQNMKGKPQNQNDNIQIHVSRKEKGLRVDKMQSISKENFKVAEKDQDLQQFVELKLEDTTFQNFDYEVKEKKIELIVDNGENQEMVTIENIMEDPVQDKYEDEFMTHNPSSS